MRPTDPRILRRLRGSRGLLLALLATNLLVGLTVLVQAFAVAALVVAVVHQDPIARSAGFVVAFFVARALLSWVADLLSAATAARVGTAIRQDLMVRALRPGQDRAAHQPAQQEGDLAVLATRGVAAAEPYLTKYVPALVMAVVLPPLVLLSIGWVDLLSGIVVLATLPLIPVFGALVGLATRDRARTQWQQLASLSGHFVDVVKGLPTLVAFRRARAQVRVVRSVTDDYRRATMETLRLAFASSAVLELVATLSVALVAVLVGVRLAAGSLDLQTGLVVLLLAPEAYWPLRTVGAEFHAAAEGVATFEKVSDLLDAPAASVLAAQGTGAHGATAGDTASSARATGGLVAAGLAVGYAGSPAVLEELSFQVPPRGLTLLVGPSGCGKTTLLRTLAGLQPPLAGDVTVNGEIPTGDRWQRQVAWLPQRPVVLAGSVADNLRLARESATEPELWDALGRVGLTTRVAGLAGGLDGDVGEDGRNLSAGERARLVLARALVAARPWILLDEPTAHLDAATERTVLDVIADLARTHAVLTVSHRAAVLDRADQCIVLASRRASRVPVSRTDGRPAGRPDELVSPRPARAADATASEQQATQPRPVGRGRLRLATVLSVLASASGVALTATAGWLIVTASQQPPVLTLLVAIVGVRTFGLARPVLRYTERLVSHDAVLRLLADRRADLFAALVPLTPARLGRHRGDLLASVVDDVDAVLDSELRVRQPIATAAVVVAGGAVAAGLALPAAALPVLLLGTLSAVAVLAAHVAARPVLARQVWDRAVLSDAVLEAVQSREEIAMWQADTRAVHRVVGVSRRLGRDAVRKAVTTSSARGVVTLVTGAAVAMSAAAVALGVTNGDVSPAVAAMLVLLPLALSDVVAPTAAAGALAASVRSAERRLRTLTSQAPAVQDVPDALALAHADGALSLEGVSAGWSRGPVFADLDLRLAPGERLGVVGPSGCGKSTLAWLLLRFVDPLDGRVALDGHDLTSLALDDVRRHVGLVDDDPYVFSSTLAENVRFARPGATDAEVEDALRQAHLGDWLDRLGDGLGTWLGDGGGGVSGGERARIGLARAVLADPAVLVLDEPTAHLDAGLAREVAADLLHDPDRRRTVVWVTHTEHGLESMDRVLDLALYRPRDERPASHGRKTAAR